jgi:ATP-binding cassette subfamily B protein
MLNALFKFLLPGNANSTPRSRIAALRYVPPFVRLVWRSHRGYTSAMIFLRLLRAFVPIAALWVAKLIIDEVVAIRSGTVAGTYRLWQFVALEILVVLANDWLARASAVVESLLGDLFSIHTTLKVMKHATLLDLRQLEDPNFHDVLERARRQTTGHIGLVSTLLTMGQDAVTLLSLAGALLVFSPLLLLLLTVAVLPSFLGATHFASLEYSLLYRWTPERRQLDYLRYLGASEKTAKEIQMFGLAGWLSERYRRLSTKFYEENKRLVVRKSLVASALALAGTFGYYAAYVSILLRAVAGVISLGTLTFLSASFMRSRDIIARLLSSASSIYEQCLYLKDMFDFFELQPTITSPPNAPPVPTPIRTGFVFENVGFRYPGNERWAVRGVSFTLRPGERLALVGENGAGKTTLTKLLARLYDPSEGRILLDGRDLREYDLASVRHAIGVIFQDFVRYDLHFDENIGVGKIDEVETYLDEANISKMVKSGGAGAVKPFSLNGNGNGNGRKAGSNGSANGASPAVPPVPPSIVSAAEKSLAATLLPQLPGGYRQMLGRRFDKGVDLSGGEWQKVALARAYMRDAQVLILDEPTAALDARAEYEVFTRFSELVRGRTAILISHRFSTVRMADRIIVLKNGVIAESGNHDELIARSGLYSELFKLQAVGYR